MDNFSPITMTLFQKTVVISLIPGHKCLCEQYRQVPSWICWHVQMKFSPPQHRLSLRNNCKRRQISPLLKYHCTVFPPVKILNLFSKTQHNGSRPSSFSPCIGRRNYGNKWNAKLFEEWLENWPNVLKKSGPLYLTIIPRSTSNTWYSKTRMGQHRFRQIMKSVVSCLPPESIIITNHSTRKTVVSKLKNAGQPRDNLMTFSQDMSVRFVIFHEWSVKPVLLEASGKDVNRMETTSKDTMTKSSVNCCSQHGAVLYRVIFVQQWG